MTDSIPPLADAPFPETAALDALERQEPPAFLVGVADGIVLRAGSALAPFHIVPGARAPAAVRQLAGTLAAGGRAGRSLARLRLPGAFVPRLFTATPVALAGRPCVLFVDATGEAAPAPRSASSDDDRPRRFAWSAHADGRIASLSRSLLDRLPGGVRFLGATFPELEADGLLEDSTPLAAALADGIAFSDIGLRVPGDPPMDLELGGIPILGPLRQKIGTRGFGVILPPAVRKAPGAVPVGASPQDPSHGSDLPGGAANVVSLHGAALSATERSAFHEIARTLSAAIEDWRPQLSPEETSFTDTGLAPQADAEIPDERELFDRLPFALLVQQEGGPVFANRAFLSLSGFADLEAFLQAGGLTSCLEGPTLEGRLTLTSASGAAMDVEVRLVSGRFAGRPALLHVMRRRDKDKAAPSPAALAEARAEGRRAAFDALPLPALLVDGDGAIRLANAAAAGDAGYDAVDLTGEPFTVLFAPECHEALVATFDGLSGPGTARAIPLQRQDRDGARRPGLGLLAAAGSEDPICLLILPDDAALRAMAGETPMAEGTETVLHGLAHRLASGLRVPLDALKAWMERQAPGDGEAPEPVREATRALSDTLDDLAELYGSADGPRGRPLRRAVDLSALARAAAKAAEGPARRRDVALRLDAETPASALAEMAPVACLVRLMVEESLAAAPAGGQLLLSTGREDGEMGPQALLILSDNGAGLDEPMLAGALPPFDAAGEPDRFAATGRPLRLARLVAMARRQGGDLRLTPGFGRGLTLTLCLPAT